VGCTSGVGEEEAGESALVARIGGCARGGMRVGRCVLIGITRVLQRDLIGLLVKAFFFEK
jgi:hypothetical protein